MSPAAKNKSNNSAGADNPKPARHYTEYNLFFQLEREYILQVILSVEPTHEPSDIFHHEHTAHYQGPHLPCRYDSIVLLNDWYIPGKARRRKRLHRKSHGAIGFHELSLKIAEAWAAVDDEVRIFCACLSDIGMLQYKRDLLKYNQDSIATIKNKTTATKSTKKMKELKHGCNIKHEAVACKPSVLIANNPIISEALFNQKDEETALPVFESSNQVGPNHKEPASNQEVTHFQISYFNTNNQETNHQTHEVHEMMNHADIMFPILSRSSSVAMMPNAKDSLVDMEDDEIMNLWTSTVITPGEAPREDVIPDSNFVSQNPINQVASRLDLNIETFPMLHMPHGNNNCNTNGKISCHNIMNTAVWVYWNAWNK